MTMCNTARVLSALVLLSLLVIAFPQSTGASCNIDICIAYDSSGPLYQESFDRQKDFIAGEDGVLDSISEAAGSQSVRYAAVQFSTRASTVSALSNDVESVKEAVKNSKFNGGSFTFTSAGILLCANKLQNNKRRRVIALLTYGFPNFGPPARRIAGMLKGSGIAIVVVGIGNKINESLLREIASGNPSSFFKTSADGLGDIVSPLTTEACKGASGMRPVASPYGARVTPSPYINNVSPSPYINNVSPTPEELATPTPEDIETPTPEVTDTATTPRTGPPNGNGGAGPSVTLTESPSPEEFTETPTPDEVDVTAEPEPEPVPFIGPRMGLSSGAGYDYSG